mgnify:CR=1 FL=1
MYNRTSLNRRGKTWQGTAGFCRFLNLEYGYSIPETCKKVQEKVKTAIENMTGLEVSDVNISIAGVALEEEK